MAVKFLTGIDLGKNEIQNAVVQNLTVDPSGAQGGQIYYNSSENRLKVYDGSNFVDIGVVYSLPAASTGTLGGVKIDDSTIGISSQVISVKNSGVTLAKIANIATARVLGNVSGSAAAPSELTSSQISTFLGLGDGATLDTAAIADGGTGIATADQIHTFVTGFGYSTLVLGSTDETALAGDTTVDNVSKANLLTALASFDSNDTVNIGDSGDDTTVVIRGNLQVDGTTTTVNSATLDIADNQITLNSDLASDATPTEDADIIVNRGSGTDVAIKWDESASRWKITNDGTTYFSIPTSDTNTQRTDEQIRDVTAAQIVTNGSHTNITATDDDSGNGIDLSVATATASALGVARVAAGDGIDVSVANGVFTVTGETSTASNPGIVELATNTETTTGTDTARATTPANVKAAIDARSKVMTISGDATKTSFDLTHNLGSLNVIVQVMDYGNAGTGATYETVMPFVKRTSSTVVRVEFGTAPSATQDYKVMITKCV